MRISQAVSNSNPFDGNSFNLDGEALEEPMTVETQSLKKRLQSVDDAAKQEERLTAKSRSEGVRARWRN